MPVAKSYGKTYSPLFHGNLGQFGHELYAHPLGPILDAATVLTLGGGGVAKAGTLLDKAGAISETSRLANLGKAVELTTPDFGGGEDIVIKQSSRNPVIRLRQQTVNNLLNKLPSETPVLGSTARGVRALMRQPERAAATLQGAAQKATASFARLSPEERVAWHLKARGLTPGQYADYLAQSGEKAPSSVTRLLADPKVAQLVATPSRNLRAALDDGRALSERLTALRIAGGHIDELTGIEAPYRHLKLVGGAKMAPVMTESPALVAARTERDSLAGQFDKAQQADAAWLHQTQTRNLGSLSPQDAQVRLAYLDQQYQDLVQRTVPHVSPYGGTLSKQEQLARNFTAGKTGKAPLRVSEEERQLADKAIRDAVARNPTDPAAQAVGSLLAERDALRSALTSRAEASIFGTEAPPLPSAPAAAHASVPMPSNPLRDTLVTLGHRLEAAQARVDRLAGNTVKTGEVRLTGGPTTEQLMQQIEAAGGEHPFYVPDSAHTPGIRSRFSSRPSGFAAPAQGVKQSQGVLFSKGLINVNDNALARDYRTFASQARAQLIHDELVKHAAIVPKGEPIPYGYEELPLNRGHARASYTERTATPLEHELSQPTLRDRLAELSRQALEETSPEQPHRLVVPTQVRKMIEDNAARPYRSTLRRLAFDQPTNIWKHLILGLRPAFFGNITVGNSILGTLQMAPGRFGIAGWLNQVLPGAERLFGPRLSEETIQAVLPEQAYGTFGHDVGFSSNAGLRTGQKLYQGVMPATIAYENVLRRAMAEGWAKADPEVQALMRRNGGDVNAALRAIAQSHPQVINDISRRIDDALGNYRTYNRLERALKAIVPFYGWNRHLTSSVVRLALERPQVLDPLFQTGEEGKPLADKILAALPAYLQGSLGVHLPGWLGGEPGMQQILTMQSLNPFNTLVDEGNIAAAPFHKAGASSDAFPLNPFAQAAIEQLTGTNLLTGHPLKGNALANEAKNLTSLESLLADLARGGRHPSPNAANRNTEYGQLLRYLGLPVENVTPQGG